MGILVPLSSLSPSEKQMISQIDQRYSQHKCVVKECGKLGGNSGGDVNSGAFKEMHADYVGNSPDDKCPSMHKL